VLAGGMNSWAQAGAPVEHGEIKKWALERQVRLVAGMIVFLSVIASIWYPPLKWLAFAVGFGLSFAAVTNTCAMGMLLAKLPYNRGPGCDIDEAIARLSRPQLA
jgi:Inner membrane protein YgaP-like, transmembrane domain